MSKNDKLLAGQIWKERDTRFSREVEIMAVGPAQYRSILAATIKEIPAGRVLLRSSHNPYGPNPKASRLTMASASRFIGPGTTGYTLVKEK